MTSIETLVDRQLSRFSLKQRAESHPPMELTAAEVSLRVITISRQAGSGGRTLARTLAESLGFEFIDHQILDYIAKNTGAREKLLDSLDEKSRSGVELWVEGILRGRYVDQMEYMHWLVKSVTAMAEHGNAVILGRGGNVILGARGGLHIRVVAPRDLRIANLVNYRNMPIVEAKRTIDLSDDQRRSFHRENFGSDIDNPQDYHLVLNTGSVSLECARKVILELWRENLCR